MLRDTVRDFSAKEISPRAPREIDRSNQFPPDLWTQARRARAARHHGRGGVRRHGDGLSRAYRRDGGDLARLGLGRACPTARTPTCASTRSARNGTRGAEEEVPAEARLRRARRRARDVRAGRRLGRRRHAAAAPSARGDRYVLNGNKMWITNGPDADVLVVYGKTSDRRSPPSSSRRA
mgnify:CR=1 FL=1